MSDLQQYTCKLCLIKYELDINVFVSFKLLIFFDSFSIKVTWGFFVYKKKKFAEIINQKHDGIFNVFDQI